MVSFSPQNVFKLPTVLKLAELVLGLVIMILHRAGGKNGAALLFGISPDADIFGIMVVYGYFYILLFQILGIILGDKLPVQNSVVGLLGFIFFMAVGIVAIHDSDSPESLLLDIRTKMNALGSLCIINSCIYAAEGVLHTLNLRKDD